MSGYFDYILGNLINGNQGNAQSNPMAQIQMPSLNIPPIQQNPFAGMRNPMTPQANPMVHAMPQSPMSPPPYAVNAGIPNGAAPPPPYAMNGGMPNGVPQQNGAMPGARPPQQEDPLKKAMMMQALMGGGDDGMQGPNGALPSGSNMRGSGGFQLNPEAGLLNSFPPQMPPRKRFIGGAY